MCLWTFRPWPFRGGPAVSSDSSWVDRWGRRWSMYFCMFATTVAFGLNIGLVNLSGTDTAVHLVYHRQGIRLTSAGLYVGPVHETSPTCVQHRDHISAWFSIIASTTTPSSISLDNVDKRLPYVVFTTIGVIGSNQLRPETKGYSAGDIGGGGRRHVQELEIFGAASWLRRRKQKKSRTRTSRINSHIWPRKSNFVVKFSDNFRAFMTRLYGTKFEIFFFSVMKPRS